MEAEEGRESLRRRIEAQLKAQPELKAVFGRLWEGDKESAEIAQRLGMEERAVVLARRRLARRLKGLSGVGIPSGAVSHLTIPPLDCRFAYAHNVTQ